MEKKMKTKKRWIWRVLNLSDAKARTLFARDKMLRSEGAETLRRLNDMRRNCLRG